MIRIKRSIPELGFSIALLASVLSLLVVPNIVSGNPTVAVDLDGWQGPPILEATQTELIDESTDGFQEFEATAYCIYGTTFSGVKVRRGIVAADPKILPIGSVIELRAGDYSGIYTVMDTGAVIKGELIDVYVPDYEEAIQFGRQQVELRIIRRGWKPEPSSNYGHSVAG